MKAILAATVTALLLATAAVKAGPLSGAFGVHDKTGTLETAQFRKKGKGFKKGAFKKGAFKKGGGKRGPQCFNKCVAKGKLGQECQVRCR